VVRRRIFGKLVKGYKTWLRQKEKKKEESKPLLEEPVEITGAIEIKEPEKKVKEVEKGIKIPEFKTKRVSRVGIEELEEKKGLFKAIYPLIPENPSKDEPIMAYARIEWNQNKNQYEYKVIQPKLSGRMRRLIIRLKELLEEKLDVDFTKLKTAEAREYVHKQVFKLIDYFGIKLSQTEKQILSYHITKDFLGLGPIEPLMHDPNIEDISCDGVNIPIYVFHRNPLLGSIPTNIIFTDEEELDNFLVRLAQLCGQSISVIDPLLQGTLPDGSRVQGTLATDIARKGSNFTIRKFTKYPFTPTHLLNFGTIDIKTLAFLWLAVDYGSSILVTGSTATGKTVFLNVLSLFIRPNMKIVSIEDTAELKLPHPHWIPHVARTSISTEAGKIKGEIDLFDLLRESLRQRPDYIIVGEVRGKEAYVLFQQMALGHPSFATIHSETLEKLIDRLTSPPIELPSSLLQSLDLIVFLIKMKYRGKYVRKVESIYEVVGFDTEKKRPITRKIFEWDASRDKIIIKEDSVTLQKIIKRTGLKEKHLIEELKRRMVVLYWLQERNITDYRDVSQIINLYYNYPERVMDTIAGEV